LVANRYCRFRIDAVTYLTQIPQTKNDDFKFDYNLLKQMRNVNDSSDNNHVLLGEASVEKKRSTIFLDTMENSSTSFLIFMQINGCFILWQQLMQNVLKMQ